MEGVDGVIEFAVRVDDDAVVRGDAGKALGERRLRPGEVGLLLPDTTAAHAAAVAKRLRAALTALAASRSSIKAIGFATRMPGEGVAEGILNHARANAMRRAGNGAVHSAAS